MTDNFVVLEYTTVEEQTKAELLEKWHCEFSLQELEEMMSIHQGTKTSGAVIHALLHPEDPIPASIQQTVSLIREKISQIQSIEDE